MDRCIRVLGCNAGRGCGNRTEGWKAVRVQRKAIESKDEKNSSPVLSQEQEPKEDDKEIHMRQMRGTLKGNDTWAESVCTRSTWDDQGGNCDDIDNALESLLLVQEQDKKPQHHLQAAPHSEGSARNIVSVTSLMSELKLNPSNTTTQQQRPSHLCFELDFIEEPEQSEDEVTDSAIEKMISLYKAIEDDPEILAFLKQHEKLGHHKQQNNDNAFNSSYKNLNSSKKSIEKYEKTPAALQANVKFQSRIRRCPEQVRQAKRVDNGNVAVLLLML